MVATPADELQRRMAATRLRLSGGVEAVADDVRKLADWRHHMRRYSWVILGVSAVAGFWLAPRRTSRPAPKGESHAAVALTGPLAVPQASRARQRGWLATGCTVLGSALLRACASHAGRQISAILDRRIRHQPSQNGAEEAVGGGHFGT